MSETNEKKSKKALPAFLALGKKRLAGIIAALITAVAVLVAAVMGLNRGGGGGQDTRLIPGFWPDAFVAEAYDEPAFDDDPSRTNNAFNVVDFGEQGTNGWFYRYGDYRRPERSKRCSLFDGEKYYQPGATGLEIKSGFVHTATGISPILEWRAAEKGKVNVTVSYVKNVNGDANPSFPDGVQLVVYKGSELLGMENVPISTETENFAQIKLDNVPVEELESLYFVVNPQANNAYDGGSLYVVINDVNAAPPSASPGRRSNNNANSVSDFGVQGSNGWLYMFGTSPADAQLVSHVIDGGEYLNGTSPSLTIKKDFIHPSLNHNAILGWAPAVNGTVDLRIRYTKFEQNDGNPNFPDGVRIKAFKNNTLLWQQYVSVPAKGENLVKYRIPALSVTTGDRLYFMVDPEGNSSYDGGALDVTVIDVNGLGNENSVVIDESEIRQNVANVMTDFGPQGSNGWIFQSGYGDDPFNAYNMTPYYQSEDRYFSSNWLEIKRDYVNTGEHDSSAIIKWKVAQNGTVSVKASYTKMKNEDSNPAWPDGTRVTLYLNNQALATQTFAPERNREVTKRLDIPSLRVRRGDYITMVVNGIDNNAYDGGKYEFSINSLSGLVGDTEKTVPATFNGKRVNFASTLDDFNGVQGYNGWYYQYGYDADPFKAVNIENCENGEKWYTKDGVEIKKDYIVPGPNGKSANVKWVAAETGVVNVDLQYTKLKNEDGNPSWPDGVTVYLFKNGTLLRKEYFAPLTDREVTKDLSVNNVPVVAGDCITMIVDPGENSAYDGGKYRFVIEDAAKTPTVKVGNNDNSTSLAGLTSMTQGTDGWWFLEGTSPADAKVLTKMIDNNTGYGSRRTEGLVMKKDFVHTGAALDPIYQFVAGENGNVDITGSYLKFGQEDSNPNWPDGVTLKIYLNNKVLLTKKVNVLRGDGNNNTASFDFSKVAVKRGDKISFQICGDNNNAWDGGQLSVAIEPTVEMNYKPGDDNRTVLGNLDSIAQGTDGWYFMEGTSLSNIKPLTKLTDDKSGYVSVRDTGLEMKKDYVHTGTVQSPIYRWVVKEDGKVDVVGNYTKFGQNDANPTYPDGVTVIIYQNSKELLHKKVPVKQGDGNDNVLSFSFEGLEVKANDILSFQISPDNNNAWDAGRLAVAVEPTSEIDLKPGDDNETVLGSIANVEQGTDGWYFMEGTSLSDAKPLTNLSADKSAYTSVRDSGMEVKKDYVHPGASLSPIYRWVVKEDGTVNVTGNYTKFGHNDSNPSWPDGVTVIIYLNDEVKLNEKVAVKQGDGNDTVLNFSFDELEVKANDILSFQISPNSNNAWDAGRLSVTVKTAQEEDPDRTNNTVLLDDFSGEQGKNGWYYGMCDWDSANYSDLEYDAENERYYNNGKPELKKDFVEPGQGRNAAYKWVVAKDGTINVSGEYVKFANSEDPSANGTCMRIFLNGGEVKWFGGTIQGNFDEERSVSFDETLEVKAGDELIFAIDPDGNDAYDGGRLSVTIKDAEEEPEPDRTNNTVLLDDFSGEQGKNGWYYGMCDWDSANYSDLEYDAENERYYNNGKPELKKDFVEPGQGRNAAYKWVVAKDGTINVSGEYVKFANSEDPSANGTCMRIFLNGGEVKWYGGTIQGNFADERSVSFNETLDVKAGDELIFAIDPDGSDALDGGRLSVTIKDAEGEPEPAEKYTVTYEYSGEYPEAVMATLPTDSTEYDDGAEVTAIQPEKTEIEGEKDGESGTWTFDGWDEEKKTISGSNVTFTGTWTFTAASVEPALTYKVTYEYDGTYPEEVMATLPSDSTEYEDGAEVTAIQPNPAEVVDTQDGEPGTWTFDGWDAEKKTVSGSDVTFTGTWTFTPTRTNNAVLADDFSGVQGTNGWHYGTCDWLGANFQELAYNADNKAYSNGTAELKADFVHPGDGVNAGYKWVAARSGKIRVSGSYTKYANSDDPNADGTCVRICINGGEKKWMGTMGNFAEAQTVTFDEVYDVEAGDELVFAINPETNYSYDGGKLEAVIRAE